MKHSNFSRFLSVMLALVMVLSMIPATVFASDSAVYSQITSAEELTTGKYVLVVDSGFAPTVLDGSWVLAEAVTAADGTITAPAANLVWDITVDGDTVKLTDSNGITIAPKGGNNNGILSGDYSWSVTCENGTFRFWGQGSDTVVLASNKSSANKFRGYKTATVSGNAAGYPSYFTLYKLAEGTVVEPSEPIETEPVVTEPVVTEPVEVERVTGVVTDLTTLQDGDSIVIFNPANGKSLSSNYSGYYNGASDVALEGGALTGYTDADVWTLGINADGTYTFATAAGQKISMGTSFTSMPLDDVNTDWNIIASNTEGCFYIENPARGAYMEYQPSYGTWSGYYSINDESLFAQQLYLIVEGSEPVDPEPTDPVDPEPSEPEVPEVETAAYMTEAPKNGDTILIYHPNSTSVLGSAASGKKLAAVTAAAENGAIALADGMAQLLVTVENEQYIFTLDGKYLTSAETGNGLSFAEELTDMGRWTLELQDDGKWVIMNVGANYNGNHNQALEYYNGFTTYGFKSGNAAYLFDLYLVEAAKQEGIVTELHEGDTVVIFNPAHMKAMSTEYIGFYNLGTDVALSGGKLTGWTAADVWTVGVNADGSYTFATADGKKLSMGTSYSSMPLDDVNTAWSIETAKTENCFYIKNVARGVYVEWYADKGNWSSYYNNSNEALFAQQFYLVVEGSEPETTLPAEGDQVVLYNLDAQGVLANENDTQSIENALTVVTDGVAAPANGGVVFTVSKNGNYYRFYNETYGYLCSNGTGNNAFYTQEVSEDADWALHEGKSGGWNLESRTAKFNGTYSQYLEYYADSYKTYSMYNVTNYDIYEFFFYPVAEGVNLTGGIVNVPTVVFGTLPDAFVGADYTFTVTVDAVFGVETMTVKVGDTVLTANNDGSYTIPAELVAGESLTITVEGVDTKGAAFSGTAAVTVKDEPVIESVSPAANSQTLDNKRPTISAVIANAGENAVVTMTVNGEAVEAVYADGIVSWTSETDMADGRTTVTVTVTRADGKTAEKTWSFTVGEAQFSLYFGQLHSHTTYSDGSGSLESALNYIGSLPESANVDFVAFTDHSNYFDTTGSANPEGALYDMSLASASSQDMWNEYKGAIAAFNKNSSDVVAIGGFEMTWSGGPGHINTFATPGIVSRNNSVLNNKTADAGMKAYYALLSQPEGIDSISQFNHPGTTFGNFTDFAYWDALIDTRIQLVEVGNGEGQVGAGGYYPSYEQYTMALDKGWHVAPTNNQDNHKGKWGNANDARDVVLTDDFSEEGIYEAIRAYRVYATEDRNLELGYTVNGFVLGSIIEEVPEVLNFEVTVFDPDSSDSISKVEVIVNSGKVAHVWDDPAELTSGVLTAALAPDYSYYYLRVTQGDGDIAVTAPVWVGETLKLGISAVECGTSTPVTGEELTISTTLFNSEVTEASVKSVTYTVGSQVLAVDTTGYTIPASGNTTVAFNYTPEVAKVMNVTVTAIVELDGVEYTFSMDVELDVQDASKLVYIGIDASHYNEYVNGNYKDSMGNFGNLAAGYSVRTVQLNTSEDLIAACDNDKYVALILTAPSRRLAAAQADPKVYTADELKAITAFNANGGTVILAGWSDNYENYDVIQSNEAIVHMAAAQNAVLEALGSSLRIGDDATYDDVRSAADGVDKWRLYFNTYGDNFLTEGVEYDAEHPYDRMYTEVFSHYGGATVYAVDETGTATSTLPATVSPVVFAHASTYSVDVDKDGLGGSDIPKYAYTEGDDRLLVMGMEQLDGQGLIIVSGAAFMSNFEVQATIEDSGSEKNYSNYRICENLVNHLNPVTVTDIADVQAQVEEGVKYTIEGVITSNASGYDKDTAFFDCIYLQDETAGINAFPVAGNFKIGDKVRITGTTSSYQGERQISVTEITLISEGNEVAPIEITAAELNDGSVLGSLVTLKGIVESFEYANGLIQTIMVKDEKGETGRIFIDGYITTSYDVENLTVGCEITVTGLASYDNSFDGPAPRIRVRDRKDVVCTAAAEPTVIASGWSGYTTWTLTSDGTLTVSA
ncbi:MAG: hypothetical protein E7451_10105, partial [Ruminococcaceae bacterium]|nr:hypothetical protein [Oscillospiraceae bacterium]